MNKKIVCALFSFLVFSVQFSIAQKTNQALDQFVNRASFKNASIGICVKDFSNNTILSYNPNQSLTPASILKVVTTATALEVLGEDFVYKTTLAKDKTDSCRLLIHGYGDPTLGSSFLGNDSSAFLTKWVDEIGNVFDKKSELHIVAIDNYFGYDGVSNKWLREDLGSYYASGSFGLSVFDNAYKLYLNTTNRNLAPNLFDMEPFVYISFVNELTLNDKSEDAGLIIGEPFSYNRVLTGSIPAGRKAYVMKGDIPNPGSYLAEVLSRLLSENRFGKIDTQTSRKTYQEEVFAKEKTSYDEDIFYTHTSYPLRNIVREVNVRSNNHYAEHLIRTIGRAKNPDIYSPSLQEGIAQVKDLWAGNGLDTDALFMYDGSGLAPSNAVSPQFVCDVLLYMQNKSKYANAFFDSFPKAGQEGTVKALLRKTRLEGKVFVKSGTISGVKCYAGYCIDGDKKYAFAIMVNKYNGSHNEVVKAIGDLLLNIF